jgi:hypothetical protein
LAIPNRTNIALHNIAKSNKRRFETGASKVGPDDFERILSAANSLNTEKVLDFLIDRKTTKSKQVRDIVPIKEWLRDEYYLGDESRTLYRYWEDVLVEFVETDKNELIIGGSLRSGKSTCALILAIRKLYELSCYDPIPSYFGLSTSSLILFMYLSITMAQAMRLGLGRICRMMDKIPYFKEHFPRDNSVESYLKFGDPSLMMIGGSEMGHFRGTDLYFLIFDEANFAKGGIDLKFENAVNIYRESTIRRKSTFMVDAREQGVGIIISSADTQSSFVEKHIEEVKSDPNVLIVHSIAYEVQPDRYKGMDRFWVFEGDELVDPFLPDYDADSLRNFCRQYKQKFEGFAVEKLPARLRSKFLTPPISFLKTFQMDIFGALKEVCGVSIGQSGRFFSNRVKFNECFPRPKEGEESKHPFTSEHIVCSYIDSHRVEDSFLRERTEFNPNFEYFGGVDQSITDDTTGMALCHIDPEADNFEVTYDFLLRVEPPKRPAKISPEKITDFYIFLKEKCGLRNLSVAMDWYATQQSVQTLHMNAIDGDIHSVDRTWDDYRSFAGSILDNHVKGYMYEPFREELFSLVQDNDRKKIDHPGGGSKDVADAATQAHRLAMEAWLEIKGGIRYFPDFGNQNLEDWRHTKGHNLVAGIYFGPESYYVVWCYREDVKGGPTARDYGMLVNPKKASSRIKVIGEFVDSSGTNAHKVMKTKERSIKYGGKIVYAGDPAARMGGDITAASPIKEFRKLGLPVRCRRHMDRESMDPIHNLIRDKANPRLVINEGECPLLARGLRKAKHRLAKGVKMARMDNTGEEYPVYALRIALEDALSKATVGGY